MSDKDGDLDEIREVIEELQEEELQELDPEKDLTWSQLKIDEKDRPDYDYD